MNGLLVDDIQNIHNVKDIWKWLEDLSSGIGGLTYDAVQANCGYNTNTQQIFSDGIEYTVYDPTAQYQSCENIAHVAFKGEKRDVFLTGNNEVLSFGLFTQRSAQKKSTFWADGKGEYENVVSDTVLSLSPTKDPKIIELCDVQ